jgi:hypothetical protein
MQLAGYVSFVGRPGPLQPSLRIDIIYRKFTADWPELRRGKRFHFEKSGRLPLFVRFPRPFPTAARLRGHAQGTKRKSTHSKKLPPSAKRSRPEHGREHARESTEPLTLDK